jgi:hypothetical protein
MFRKTVSATLLDEAVGVIDRPDAAALIVSTDRGHGE